MHAIYSNGLGHKFAGALNAPKLLSVVSSVLDAALLNDQWPVIDDFGTGAGQQQDERSIIHSHPLNFDSCSQQSTAPRSSMGLLYKCASCTIV
jgi:hypothetical protein